MKKLSIALVALAVTLPGAAACGRSDPGPTDPGRAEPTAAGAPSPAETSSAMRPACDYLSAEEASDAVGEPLTGSSMINDNPANSTNCVYGNDGTTLDDIVSAGVTTVGGYTEDTIEAAFEASTQQYQSGVEQVSGLGDAAFYAPGLMQLNVREGTDWFIVYAGTQNQSDRDAIDKIARTVLSHR